MKYILKFKHFTLLAALFLVNIGSAQIIEKELLGTWELQDTQSGIDIDKTDMILLPNENEDTATSHEADIILQFADEQYADIVQFGTKNRVQYVLKDSLLKLGARDYNILKLTKTELVLKDPSAILASKYFYTKTNKSIAPTKAFETVHEKYENGQLKLKGTLRNGFEDGTWTEWYENGQKKSERHFVNGLPSGTWKKWNALGQLIDEKTWR